MNQILLPVLERTVSLRVARIPSATAPRCLFFFEVRNEFRDVVFKTVNKLVGR